jgi:hypothetical protein
MADTKTATFLWDSGASRHLISNPDILLGSREPEHPVSITFANGERDPATAEGSVYLLSGGSGPDLEFCKALHVPSAKVNLLSIGQIVEQGYTMEFTNKGCYIKDGDFIIRAGDKEGSLFTVKGSALCEPSAMAIKAKETPELWHWRLGHLNLNNVRRIITDDLARGVNISGCDQPYHRKR